MMLCPRLRWLAPMLCATFLVGCGVQQAPPISATDRIATDVAAARAVAATLTMGVPTPAVSPIVASATEELPTPTAVPLPTETPEPPPPPSEVPTDIPEEPLPMAYGPGGNASNVEGGIVVPGDGRILNYSQNNNLEVSFKSPLWFRVLAYVPSADGHNKDGAGIKEVRFEITGPVANGENDTVYQHTEQSPAYCVFANSEPACPAWDFAANDNKWPDGAPVQFGENYHVQINIDGIDGHNQASWNFNFTIEAP
jgi:hypothetical protein